MRERGGRGDRGRKGEQGREWQGRELGGRRKGMGECTFLRVQYVGPHLDVRATLSCPQIFCDRHSDWEARVRGRKGKEEEEKKGEGWRRVKW